MYTQITQKTSDIKEENDSLLSSSPLDTVMNKKIIIRERLIVRHIILIVLNN